MKRKTAITDYFAPKKSKLISENGIFKTPQVSTSTHTSKPDESMVQNAISKADSPNDVKHVLSVNGVELKEPVEKEPVEGIGSEESKETKLLTVPGFRSDILNATLVRMQFVPTSTSSNSAGKLKICAFDMDHTVITTKQGGRAFSLGPSDWKFLNDQVLPSLQELGKDPNNVVVLFTNQSTFSAKPGSKSYNNLQIKFKQFSGKLDIPIRLYAAVTKSSPYRKPSIKMWEWFKQDLGTSIDIEQSFFVGDAAGRPGDFSSVDIEFAVKCGLKFYTPEKFWTPS
jgi:DNA 3'-phosphatase